MIILDLNHMYTLCMLLSIKGGHYCLGPFFHKLQVLILFFLKSNAQSFKIDIALWHFNVQSRHCQYFSLALTSLVIHCFYVYNMGIFILASVCPVVKVKKARVNTSGCVTHDSCVTGTKLEYSCDEGLTIPATITTCLPDHSWSPEPTCLQANGLVFLL